MPDNTAQRDFWTDGLGARWARNAATMERSFAALKDALLEHAELEPGERVLEIGFGGGGMSATMAEQVGPGGHVHGVDISETLKAVADAATARHDNVTLALADAQEGDLGSGYDAMVSSFGMMFFADPVAGLRNIAAALKPGGRLTFLCWTEPPKNPWFALNGKIAAETFGPLEVPPPDAPGPFGFQNIDRTLSLMSEAGLTGVASAVQDIMIDQFATANDVAELGFMMGPNFDLARQANYDADAINDLKAKLAEAFRDFETVDGVRLPTRTVIYSARVPA